MISLKLELILNRAEVITRILRRYLLTLGGGILLGLAVFIYFCGLTEECFFFILVAAVLSIITVPIPIALMLHYNAISDLDQEVIEEKLKITHILTGIISAFLETIIAYAILGGEGYLAIFGTIAVVLVYAAYLISSLLLGFFYFSRIKDADTGVIDRE